MTRLRLAASLAIACLAFLSACSDDDECNLGDEARSRAGTGAIDCGHVALGDDPKTVDDCVTEAFETDQPFYAEYEARGTDSDVVRGIARNAEGTVTFLLWDSDPSGGGGHDPVISGDVCVEPPTLDPNVSPPVTCPASTPLMRVCE
jgi:hypothetical protein